MDDGAGRTFASARGEHARAVVSASEERGSWHDGMRFRHERVSTDVAARDAWGKVAYVEHEGRCHVCDGERCGVAVTSSEDGQHADPPEDDVPCPAGPLPGPSWGRLLALP